MNTKRTQHRRDRGSVIVLVVIVLVLMAMLGTAYIQVARMDRIATQVVEGGNIDAVARATMLYLGDVLRSDLVDRQNNFFNPTGNLNGTVETGYDEAYDYPWTNTAPAVMVALGSGTSTASGGRLDDTWLASTAPDFETDPSKPRWPHVTNLNLTALLIPKAGGSEAVPSGSNGGEYGLQPTNAAPRTDTNLIITNDAAAMDDTSSTNWEPFGADADADGVPDSLWTWAPIRQISGVTYVMAVRIVDNSALLNLNTASVTFLDGQAAAPTGATHPDARDLPRGLFPSDLDLSRFLVRAGDESSAGWLATVNGELATFLTGPRRTYTYAAAVVPFDGTGLDLATWPAAGSWDSAGRVGDYLNRTRLYGYAAYNLSVQDELEFRYRNGLNNADAAYSVESLLPTLLRQTATGENSYTNVDYTSTASGTDVQKMLAYFQGAASSDPANGSIAIQDRTFPALRHMVTTRSGANAHATNIYPNATNYTNVAPTWRRQKFDLTHLYATDPANRALGIVDRIYNVLSLGTGATAYLGINPATQAALLQQIAGEYTLAIMDYMDTDSIPSSSTIGGVVYYGLERMPFLREAYVQAGYTEIDNMDAGGIKVGDAGYTVADNTYDTWQFAAGSQAIVLEVGNPFSETIDLGDAALPPLRVAVIQGGVEVSTDSLNSTSLVLAPRDPTGTNLAAEQALLYRQPATPVTEDGGTEGANVLADLEVDALAPGSQKASVGALTYVADGTDITVALQVQVGGVWVTYDRLTVAGFQVPAQVDFPNSAAWVPFVPGAPNVPAARSRHYQQSLKRDGENMRYLSNAGIGATARGPNTPNYARRGVGTNVDQLWVDNKGVAGDLVLDRLQLPLPNRPILNVAELGHIFMLGFTNEATGDLPTRLTAATVLPVDTGNARRWTLEVAAGALVPNVSALASKLPHAAILLDQFTTVSPRWDGVDNDNIDGDNSPVSGADGVEELFVPGRINVNTAPLHLLTLAASLPETINDVEAMMREVKAYRDAPASRNAITGLVGTLRQEPGVAHLGELITVNPAAPTVAWDPSLTASADAITMQRYGNNAAAENLGAGQPTDMYPLPEATATGAPAPVPVRIDTLGSPEERMSRYQFLTQVFTTRSDIFTAYIYIRGYPSGDFRTGPLEAKRLLVVFDRSNVITGNEAVRILGLYEFPN